VCSSDLTTMDGERTSVIPLMDAILEHVPPPPVQDGPVQMQVATIEHSDYVGRTGIGRVYRGTLDMKTPVVHMTHKGAVNPAELKQLWIFEGLGRKMVDKVECGELCAVVGIADIDIGDTLSDAAHPEILPPIRMDEPTLSMIFRINDSPFFGRDGTYCTSRHLRQRLILETKRDVALRVEEMSDESFKVSGRGVLHLSILIENMRREGFEMTVAQPQVIFKDIDGQRNEPIELLFVDAPEIYAGKVIELVGQRRGELIRVSRQGDRKIQEFHIPTRGTIGLRSKLLTVTAGEAILFHSFTHYAPAMGDFTQRNKGAMVSMANGKAAPFALDGLQLRGCLFVDPGKECYEGMIVGEHCLDSDLVVNIQKCKMLTNVRAAGRDRNLDIAPALKFTLEEAIEYIAEDELVEITPLNIRLRKRILSENDRKRVRRQAQMAS
jgi:GTP-binding protein